MYAFKRKGNCFTRPCNNHQVKLQPEFIFKDKATRTHLYPPAGVNCQWVPKRSYRIEQILDMIKQLSNRFNILADKGFAVYVLDGYAVHLMPEIQQELYKKGYIRVIISRGITGDIQINDTDFHHYLKTKH